VEAPEVTPTDTHMNTDHDDPGNEPADDQRRYAELTICAGECIIYDRENYRAWIQSTVATPIAELE
jgi:hypothetical protein